MIELVFEGNKKTNITNEALSIQSTQINRNGNINTEYVLISVSKNKGKTLKKIHDLSKLKYILVNETTKVDLGAVNLGIFTPDWVNARRDALARALKLEKTSVKSTDNTGDSSGETVTPPTNDTGDNSNGGTPENDNLNPAGDETNTGDQNEPTTSDNDNETDQQPSEVKMIPIKFVNTQNDNAFGGLEYPAGESVQDMLKELAQRDDTKEAFLSMITSDAYKFTYWGIVQADGTDVKVGKSIVDGESVTLKAHWKNK